MIKCVTVGSSSALVVGYATSLTVIRCGVGAQDTSSSDVVEFQCAAAGGNVGCVAFSDDGSYICAAYTNKTACCWDFLTGEVLGTCETNKKPTSLACATLPLMDDRSCSDKPMQVLLMADKGGEVWAIDLPHMKRKTRILGHTASVITDMIHTGDMIVTADRDEKIRVTSFPDTCNITGYLLNHRDVVTSISALPKSGCAHWKYLVSTGWDHRICVWDATQCRLVDEAKPHSDKGDLTDKTTVTDTRTNSTGVLELTADHMEVGNETKEDGEDEVTRLYDASSAGSFPMAVSSFALPTPCCPSSPISILACVSWKSSEITFYYLSEQVDCEEPYLRFDRDVDDNVRSTSLLTPAPPVGCAFMDGHLVVLLPAPHYMKLYTVSLCNADGVFSVDASEILEGDIYDHAVTKLAAIFREKGLTNEQQLAYTDNAEDENSGIRKHALDKPFDKDANINLSKRKKRHGRDRS